MLSISPPKCLRPRRFHSFFSFALQLEENLAARWNHRNSLLLDFKSDSISSEPILQLLPYL